MDQFHRRGDGAEDRPQKTKDGRGMQIGPPDAERPLYQTAQQVLDLCILLIYTYGMDIHERISRCAGFEWDKGNFLKNWEKHKVKASECEQTFFNQPLIAVEDEGHSQDESRYYALGHTDVGRHLFIVFTIRNNLIRVISARDMNRKERKVYEKL